MFERKKSSEPLDTSTPAFQPPPPPPAPAEAARPAASPAPAATRARTTAVIGPSIQIEGTLRGQEDVFVEGEVIGTVQLQSNTLTIGTSGKIKADVYAHTVYVEGSMEGDLYGAEQVIIRKSARVRGNITSPRVTLEDGATFKGSIEMDPESVKNMLGSAGANRGGQGARSGSPQAVGATPIGGVGSQSR